MASGGNFNPDNYDIDYVVGILTVTGMEINEWLGSFDPPLADYNLDADPDGDGLTTRMEFFMGLHPGVHDADAITTQTGPTTFSMTYRRAKGVSGVHGVVKWSSTLMLGSWTQDGITDNGLDMGDYELRTATIPLTPEQSKFMSLHITGP